MKTKFLLGMILLSSLTYSQVNFPHIASASSGKAEHVTKFGVSDTSLDFFSITNGTDYNAQFAPQFYARRATDNRLTLGITASISSATDNGTSPIMSFSAQRDDTVYPNAPTGATFPWGNSGDGLTYSVNTRPLFVWHNASTRIMTITAQNNIGIGNSSPFYKLDVSGDIRCANLITYSDSKYKENVKEVTGALETVLSLNGKTYNWKKEEYMDVNFNDKTQYGLIAQEVEEVMPDLAFKTESGDYSINYIGLIPILIEAIKEQQKQIISLQEQVNNNFQQTNNVLVDFESTKIVNVSPNPSSDIVEILLDIEQTVEEAKLIVYNLNGEILNSVVIKERGNSINKSLFKNNIGSGTFIVSFFINGKSLDSKKIIFN